MDGRGRPLLPVARFQRSSTIWDSARAASPSSIACYLLGDSGIRIEYLERTGYHQVSTTAITPEQRPFATGTGKIELYSPPLAELGLDPLPGYQPPDRSQLSTAEISEFPLILVTGGREKSYHHSRFRDQPWALKVSPDPQLTMHPETAQALGLDDGTWAHLEVARGKGACRLRVRLSDATPRNVVNTGMG